MNNNFVAKHMHKSVRASVVASKRRLLQSEATLRDAREDALNELVDSESLCFDDACNGCFHEEKRDKLLSDAVNKELDESVLNELESLGNESFSLGDIGCCSVSISDEED